MALKDYDPIQNFGPNGKWAQGSAVKASEAFFDPIDLSGRRAARTNKAQADAYAKSRQTLQNLLYNQSPKAPPIRYGNKTYGSPTGLAKDLYGQVRTFRPSDVSGFRGATQAYKGAQGGINNLQRMSMQGTGLDRFENQQLQQQMQSARGESEQQTEQGVGNTLSDLAQQGIQGGARERLNMQARAGQAQNLARLAQEQRAGQAGIRSREAERRFGIQKDMPGMYGNLGQGLSGLGGQEANFMQGQQDIGMRKAGDLGRFAQGDVERQQNLNRDVWLQRLAGEGGMSAGEQQVIGLGGQNQMQNMLPMVASGIGAIYGGG